LIFVNNNSEKIILSLAVLLSLVMVVSVVSAAGYIKIGDIDGESKDSNQDPRTILLGPFLRHILSLKAYY